MFCSCTVLSERRCPSSVFLNWFINEDELRSLDTLLPGKLWLIRCLLLDCLVMCDVFMNSMSASLRVLSMMVFPFTIGDCKCLRYYLSSRRSMPLLTAVNIFRSFLSTLCDVRSIFDINLIWLVLCKADAFHRSLLLNAVRLFVRRSFSSMLRSPKDWFMCVADDFTRGCINSLCSSS